MGDAIVEEVDGHWLVDFASCNYLGLDLDLEVIAQVPAYLARWGTHPSWARAIASPEPYRRVETAVSELLEVEDVLAFPTLTHTHNGVLPALAGEGTVLVDMRAHRTITTPPPWPPPGGRPCGGSAPATSSTPGGCSGARAPARAPGLHGRGQLDDRQRARPARLRRPGPRARRPAAPGRRPRLRGRRPARRLRPDPLRPPRNSIVRWSGEGYDHIVLTAGLSKAYSSLLAFVTCSAELKRYLKATVPSYVYSGPVPVASLATALAGLQVNQRRGDELRSRLWQRTGPCSSTWTSSASPPPTPPASPGRAGRGQPGRPGRGRPPAVRPRDLRDPRPLPGGPPPGGRLPASS